MRVAIVGTGYIAGRHAAALTAMAGTDDIEIAGFVSAHPEHAAKAAAEWGGKAYATLDELLDKENVGAVWICVPPYAHGAVERACIARGLPMYIEKPVGTDTELPSQLLMDIEAKGLIVNAGYYWRSLEVLPKLQAMLRETPPFLVRLAYHGPTAPAAWWRRQDQSGGQIVEQATHLVDIARHLLGEATVLQARANHRPRPNYPDMDIAPATAALLQFGDAPATLSASCVLGSFADTAVDFLCEGRKITFSLRELAVETAEGRSVQSTGQDPLVLADRAFIAAVRAGDRAAVPCSYAEALRTLELCQAIRTAAEVNDNKETAE